MSGGTGVIIGFLGSAAFFLVVFAVLESRSASAPSRPKVEGHTPVRPVPAPPPRPPVIQAEIVEDDEPARHMQAVRKAHERITDISRWVHESIIGEALRRAGVVTPDTPTSDKPEG